MQIYFAGTDAQSFSATGNITGIEYGQATAVIGEVFGPHKLYTATYPHIFLSATTPSGASARSANSILADYVVTNPGDVDLELDAVNIYLACYENLGFCGNLTNIRLYDENWQLLAVTGQTTNRQNFSANLSFQTTIVLAPHTSKILRLVADTTNIQTSQNGILVRTTIGNMSYYDASDTVGPDELYWSDGTVNYSYQLPGSDRVTGLSASPDYVVAPVLTYGM
jgi:hypothetical protein